MKNTPSKQRGLLFLIGLILLGMYNIVIFFCFGYKDHSPVFWFSYGAMTVSALVGAWGIFRFSAKDNVVIDWFFGYPVLRITYIYLILELIVSTVFMILEKKVALPFPVVIQVLLLGIYLVVVLSCMFKRNASTKVIETFKTKTNRMKLMAADAQMLVNMAKSSEAQQQFKALAEELQFSDPMSDNALESVERQIENCLTDAKMLLSEGDEDGAVKSAKRALFLTQERALKCKVLK